MPMIPAGVVDGPKPARVAENIPKTNLYEAAPPVPALPDNGYCLNPDGSIDNKAQTNRWAAEVADVLEVEMDVKDPTFFAGIVILAGGPLGFRFGKVSDFTGLPRPFCKRVINNLAYSRLVFNRQIAGDLAVEVDKPESEQDGLMQRVLFVLYCLAGAGLSRCDKGMWCAVAECDRQFYGIDAVN